MSIPAAAEERVVKATKIQSQEVKSAAASELPGEVRSNTILPIPGESKLPGEVRPNTLPLYRVH